MMKTEKEIREKIKELKHSIAYSMNKEDLMCLINLLNWVLDEECEDE